jgi:carbon monoxide dehydrogenase subunit G
VELTHRFTVPGTVEETWDRFGDIADLTRCFPGAQVTSVEGDSFEGTVKVKLGPIALVYAGSGSFTSKDPEAHTLVVEAKGRDKRGNGTAGATVTVAMSAGAGGTDVQVDTDLSITGKPAQFGRGVLQEVSDKLLAQFMACLEQRSAGTDEEGDQDAGPASAPTGAAATEAPAGDPDAGPASAPVSSPVSEPVSAPRASAAPPASAGGDDAIDLGTTVLPVLVRSYWQQAAAAVAAVLGVLVVVRRLRRSRRR